MTIQLERRLLDRKRSATYLGISFRSLNGLANDGQIRKTKIGHRVLFDVVDLDDYVERVKAAS